jgi:hypothetical protein
MKTKLLFLAILLATSFQFVNAQCSRSGTFVQSDPQYSISGTANITFTTMGDKNVIFESDFATVQGADLRVYISKTDDILATGSDAVQISSQLMNDGGGTGGPGVSPITGMMSFTVPAAYELNDFDYIVIQCIAINERWGHVALGATGGADCFVLGVEENTLNQAVSLYPHPANEKFEIRNDNQLPLSIALYDILGNKVKAVENSQLKKQPFSLSGLNSGVYLVEIKSDDQRIVKKLIKR